MNMTTVPSDQLKAMQHEIESLKEQVAHLQILERQLDESNDENIKLKSAISRMADENIEFKEQLATVTAQRNSLEGALKLMLERIQEPPDSNCSCHISPPCNDCVDFGGEREAFEVAKEALASLKGE